MAGIFSNQTSTRVCISNVVWFAGGYLLSPVMFVTTRSACRNDASHLSGLAFFSYQLEPLHAFHRPRTLTNRLIQRISADPS